MSPIAKFFRPPALALFAGVALGCATGLGWWWKSALVLAERRRAATPVAGPERPEKPWDFWTPEMEGLARDLRESRVALTQRETAVAQREARLAAETVELGKIRHEVESLRAEIGKRITEVQGQEMGNLRILATTYAQLTPKAAVAILTQMDDLTVAKILAQMKTETVAALLEELSRVPGENNANVKRAADLSQRLRLLSPAPKPPAG